MIMSIVLIFAGSFIGGALRFILSAISKSLKFYSFPFGTFFANITGTTLLAFILFRQNDLISNPILENFITIGLIGGLTTFSTFIYEIYELITQNKFLIAFSYIMASMLTCSVIFLLLINTN